MPQIRKNITTDLVADAKKAPARKAHYRAAGVGLYPLNSPGMPLPGPDFTEHARRLGEELAVTESKIEVDGKQVKNTEFTPGQILIDLHKQALRKPGFTMPVQIRPGLRKPVSFVPGHIWGQYIREYEQHKDIPVDGPRPASVMVIGKMPGNQEGRDGRCMVGESGKLFIEVLRELHVRGTQDWYVTNLVKFQPPDGSGTLKKSWIADCMPLLHQELRLVRPNYILCLGADASKALLGVKAGVGNMDGRVVEYTFPVHTDRNVEKDAQLHHTALVMTVVHPASVVRSPEQRRILERGLSRFNMLQSGIRFDKEETDIDHRAIHTLEQLEDLLYEIDHDPEKNDNWISVDAEWHGEHPVNPGAYMRTLQLAWRPKHAAALVFNDVEGKPCFFDKDGADAFARARDLVNQFFVGKRVVGHFLVADLEWLEYFGFHQVLRSYKVPLYDKAYDDFEPDQRIELSKLGFGPGDLIPAFMRTIFEGGHDTGLAGHAIEETAMLGLEVLLTRYTTCPRYDLPLNEWKEAYCKSKGWKAKDLEGYGPCPDEILVPYGCYDACGTLRLMYAQLPLIDRDYEGNCCREPFWEAMITAPPILEIHQTGIPASKKRIDYFTTVFMSARAAQEQKIQEWAQWPEFNIRSVMQVREFLFGERFNGKKTKEGETIRLRPPAAKSLHLQPILDTSKPPKQWWEIKEKGLEDEHSPTTNKTVLGALAEDNEAESQQVRWIRDHRFLDQVLKSILRAPKTDERGNVLQEDYAASEDEGAAAGLFGQDNLAGMVYEAGLASVICGDGRVRTHLYPTTETGRWRSARPNLQNISKRRDDDYKRLLGAVKNEKGKWVGGHYSQKLRSILYAPPGCVLIEADFKSAELFGMAIMSGDVTLLEHCRRNQLAEDDPDYYDIHANVAVLAFKLDCPPTKKGLSAIGKPSLRIAAKNVIFGVAYGRGAKAIALQCKEEGNPVSVDEAQQIINTVFQLYSGLPPFFAAAQTRSREQRWLCSCFGRFRRFPFTDDRMMAGEFERQAMNFPIQSMIASAMDRAIAYVQDYRDSVIGDPDFFRIVLQIHDAILLQVPYANIDRVAKEVLPFNMTDRVNIYPCTLDGVPTGVGPYNLGVDVEVYKNWGEPLSKDFCAANGIPLEYAH